MEERRTCVPVIHPIDLWPLGPRVVRRPVVRRTRHELEVHDGLATVTHGGTDTISAWRGGWVGGRMSELSRLIEEKKAVVMSSCSDWVGWVGG